MNYGEFWLVAQLYSTNPLAKSVAFLKQLPDTKEHADILKPEFEALKNIIKTMLEVTKCIVEFKDLPSQYIIPDSPEMSTATAHIRTAVYWTIRSIVASASQIMGLKGMTHNEYIASTTTEAWELSNFACKVSNIHNHLMKQLALCYKHIDERKQVGKYQTLVRLFEMSHVDNMRIFMAMINANDDQLSLYDGETKRNVSIDVLRMKIVLLFISDLDRSHKETILLEQKYKESRQHSTSAVNQYEVVWLPFVDSSSAWNQMMEERFNKLRDTMSWYSVIHPSLLDPTCIKYIKEVWHFNKNPMVVALDPQGRVVNPNAIHMIFIWGNKAFPFTSSREEELLKKETWRIESLMHDIDPMIHNWIVEKKYICLYEGENIEWIRNFTTTMHKVIEDIKIPLEMLYIGKNNFHKINATITTEKLSHTMSDPNQIYFFWVWLESMWHLKVKHYKTVENDLIIKEIMRMISFNESNQGWAVISKGGSSEMANAKGDTILSAFRDFEPWKASVHEMGLVAALNEHLKKIQTSHHCNRMLLPSTAKTMPDKMVCTECGHLMAMQNFTMYTCHED